jgi:hypothetical protein
LCIGKQLNKVLASNGLGSCSISNEGSSLFIRNSFFAHHQERAISTGHASIHKS